MDKRLIVGVDGSDDSLGAVDWAVHEAVRRAVALHVVYASLWEQYERAAPGLGAEPPPEEIAAEHIVAAAAERAARIAPEVAVTTRIVGREPIAALLGEGDAAAAIVLGSRGRGGLRTMLLGSTSLGVAARAPCPVVVVRGAPQEPAAAFSRIVLGVGDPGRCSAAVGFAFAQARVRDAGLVAVHAWRRPSHGLPGTGHASGQEVAAEHHEAERVLDAALLAPARAHPDVEVRRRTPEGRARGFLLDASRTADLVVVGARHRPVAVGLQLGPVSHALLHHASCPVAVVPQPG